MEVIRCDSSDCVDCDLPQSEIERMAAAIGNGKMIVYPTDTLYGLGANIFDESAVKKVYMVKGRPFDMPLSVAVADIEMLEEIAVLDRRTRILVETFLPGPLTLLVTKKGVVPDILTSASVEVGIRIPDHPFALRLIKETGPITSTSANIHSHAEPVSVKNAVEDLGEAVEYYVDCGDAEIGLPSTIVQLSDDDIEIIRKGAIPVEEIEAALNE